MVVALDCEANGVDLVHGCKPFFVAMCSDQGNVLYWQWDVDPLTREPQISKGELDEIQNAITLSSPSQSNERIIFHNALFDIRALSVVGLTRPDWFNILGDTLLKSHCYNSLEPHGLKELCIRYLGILDDDQQNLRNAVNQARTIASKKGWDIAKPHHPHFPAQKRAPKEGWWVMDMWLPRAVAQAENYESNHPWWSILKTYGIRDVERTILLNEMYDQFLSEENLKNQYEEQKALLEPVYDMMEFGISLDLRAIKSSIAEFRQESEHHAAQATKALRKNINLSSVPQMRKALYEDLRIPLDGVPATKTGPSTKASVLLDLLDNDKLSIRQQKFVGNVLCSKKIAKSGQYVESYNWFKRGNRVHPNFNITGTATTRLSSSAPNGTNIGKGADPFADQYPILKPLDDVNMSLRRLFSPEKNRVWYAIDYAQLQLRIFAYVSDEVSLIKAFDDGWDAHDYMAHRIFKLADGITPTSGQRRVAKNVNFGFIFGASPSKIEATARRPGLWDDIIKMFPNAHAFIRKVSKQVQKHGCVYTSSGYRLEVPHKDGYKGVNYIVQGDEGIIVKRAMVTCHAYLKSLKTISAHLTLNVHDELLFDFPKYTPLKFVRSLKMRMEEAGASIDMDTPVEVKRITTNWSTGKVVTL